MANPLNTRSISRKSSNLISIPMEPPLQDILIVGAGVAGLATSVGLHRLGIRSLVLESADRLRTSGFTLGTWTNAWKALDALGIGDVLRSKHTHITSIATVAVESGITTADYSYSDVDSQFNHELRILNRKVLMETLEKELPQGTIRYSSKVVHVENVGCLNSVHLADGTVLKTKVLIGCDGVNSVVAKFLGFGKARFTGRFGVRALVHYKDGHGFGPKMMLLFGNGNKYGVIPSTDHTVYWFLAFTPSDQEKKMMENPMKMKQFILSKLGKVPDKIKAVFEDTELDNMVCAPLRFRAPWELLWGNISKDNVCVAGDALHPMTPDMGQGGCVALEDAVVLARVLGEVFNGKCKQEIGDEENERLRIRKALEKFANERKWRSFEMISTSYMIGYMQQKDGVLLKFMRDKMAKLFTGMLFNKARFDCGKLINTTSTH